MPVVRDTADYRPAIRHLEDMLATFSEEHSRMIRCAPFVYPPCRVAFVERCIVSFSAAIHELTQLQENQ